MGGRGTSTAQARTTSFGNTSGVGSVVTTSGGFTVDGYGQEEQAFMRKAFGVAISAQELGEMVGMNEAFRGAELEVGMRDGQLHVDISHKYIDPTDGMTRVFGIDSKGKTFINNEAFFVAKDASGNRVAPAGFGTSVFKAQVKAAEAKGVSYLKTFALRDDSVGSVGYNVWAKLGYDAKLSPRIQRAWEGLNPLARFTGQKTPTTLHQLFRTPSGRALWERQGESTSMVFGLQRGSASLKVLKSYLKGKGLTY